MKNWNIILNNNKKKDQSAAQTRDADAVFLCQVDPAVLAVGLRRELDFSSVSRSPIPELHKLFLSIHS